jgi:hypothetical protein
MVLDRRTSNFPCRLFERHSHFDFPLSPLGSLLRNRLFRTSIETIFGVGWFVDDDFCMTEPEARDDESVLTEVTAKHEGPSKRAKQEKKLK